MLGIMREWEGADWAADAGGDSGVYAVGEILTEL